MTFDLSKVLRCIPLGKVKSLASAKKWRARWDLNPRLLAFRQDFLQSARRLTRDLPIPQRLNPDWTTGPAAFLEGFGV
jgi:hypothetical protein